MAMNPLFLGFFWHEAIQYPEGHRHAFGTEDAERRYNDARSVCGDTLALHRPCRYGSHWADHSAPGVSTAWCSDNGRCSRSGQHLARWLLWFTTKPRSHRTPILRFFSAKSRRTQFAWSWQYADACLGSRFAGHGCSNSCRSGPTCSDSQGGDSPNVSGKS